jgi:hypothetical protein
MLAKPLRYTKVWDNDPQSGPHANTWLSIWQPICPNGFTALGYVSTFETAGWLRQGIYTEPKDEDTNFRCVNNALLVQGTWANIWDTKDSDLKNPATIWRADTDASNLGLGVSVMSLAKRFGGMDNSNSFILNKSMISVNWASKTGVVKREIRDIEYLIQNQTYEIVKDSTAIRSSEQILDNCGKFDLYTSTNAIK